MADQKLSQLSVGGAIGGSDLLYSVQAGVDVQQPASAVSTFVFGAVSGDATATSSGSFSVSKINGVAALYAGGPLGTPASGVLANCTFPTLNQNTTGSAASLSATLAPGGGGTGVANNAASTISVSGNYGITLTLTGNTSVTVPTSGTLATTAQLPAGAALSAANDTNVTLTLGGSPASALLAGASVTAGWAGTLAAARLNANVVQAVTNDANVTGSITAQNLTLGWSGTLADGRLSDSGTAKNMELYSGFAGV